MLRSTGKRLLNLAAYRPTRILSHGLHRHLLPYTSAKLTTPSRLMSTLKATADANKDKIPNLAISQEASIKPLVGTSESLSIPTKELKPGYQLLQQRLKDMRDQIIAASIVTPALSAVWLLATEQMLADSPVAIAALIVGGMTIANGAIHMNRAQKYAHLSVMSDTEGPAHSKETNKKIEQIKAGDNPKVKLTSDSLTVSGVMGDIQNPSPAAQQVLSRIKQMNRVVLPELALNAKADKAIEHVHDRWMSRLMMPLNVMNIMSVASKDPKDRTIDDYLVLASASYSVYDNVTGPSVEEARNRLTNLFMKCRSPQDVVKVLVDNQMLDQGGMSFLKKWVENETSIGLRVGRTGSAILYREGKHSFCGPYPVSFFPEPKPQAAISEPQTAVTPVKKR